MASFEMVHTLDGYETVVVFTKPKSSKAVAKVDLGVIPYRPWLVGGLKNFCTWKRDQFIIKIPPSLEWETTIKTRSFLA